MTTPLPPWLHVWRQGIQPQLPSRGLLLLAEALASDDPRLIQSVTTIPPCQTPRSDGQCEGACPIGYAYWRGLNLFTAEDVMDAFVACSAECDTMAGDDDDDDDLVRHFIGWWDSTPRLEARRELLVEVHQELVRRHIMRKDAPAPKLKEDEQCPTQP